MVRPTAEEAVKTLTSFVNSIGTPDYKEFAKELMKSHPTLQQSVMSLICECIKQWSELKFVDGRNRDTVGLCKKIIKECGDEMHLRYI